MRFVVTAIAVPEASERSTQEGAEALRRAIAKAGAAVVDRQAAPGGPLAAPAAHTAAGPGAPPHPELVTQLHVELAAATAEPRGHAVELRRALAAALQADQIALDLAVQPEATLAAPRLLVMDVDSTLISVEVIDELARCHGVGAEVAEVTERAMRGELDFEASLRTRVSKLAGLRDGALAEVAAGLPLTPGAERLIAELLRAGAQVAIASGGFTFATDLLRQRLGLTAAFANVLEARDGALTGRVAGAVITPERKAQIVRELAAAAGLAPSQTVAIGDGANDRQMLAAAGFGVAFHAKPALSAMADATIAHGGLDRALAFLPAFR